MSRAPKRQCTGRKAGGTQCARSALDGRDLCAQHYGATLPDYTARVKPREAKPVAAPAPTDTKSEVARVMSVRDSATADPVSVSAYDQLDAAGRCAHHTGCVRDIEAKADEYIADSNAMWLSDRITGHAIRAFVALLEYADLAHLADDGTPLDARELALLAKMSQPRAVGAHSGPQDWAATKRLLVAPPEVKPQRKRACRAERIALSTSLTDSDALPGVVAEAIAVGPPVPLAQFIAAEMPMPLGLGTFREPLAHALLSLFDADTMLPPKSKRQAALGQFFTPAWLAAEVARVARPLGRTVLEPSAGSGNIVEALLAAGAALVVACEIDPLMCHRLRTRFLNRRVHIIEGDFLSIPLATLSHVQAIAGNPPYDGGMDSDHLARIADLIAWLEKRGGDVVEASLLLRTVVLHSQDRYARVWSRLAVRDLAACPDRIAFEIDGITGEAGKIDVSVFRLGAIVPGEVGMVRHVRAPLSSSFAVGA